ncbi:hypothetical protein A3731_21920 [Roseovarius sp. HI0049]|nr:hypothetical protein A3731_21920 [Roseovarius sp. HI0049]
MRRLKKAFAVTQLDYRFAEIVQASWLPLPRLLVGEEYAQLIRRIKGRVIVSQIFIASEAIEGIEANCQERPAFTAGFPAMFGHHSLQQSTLLYSLHRPFFALLIQ